MVWQMVSILTGGLALLVLLQEREKKRLKEEIGRLKKQLAQQKSHTQGALRRFRIAEDWLRLYDRGGTILEQCRKRKIQKIILYGATEPALHLIAACQKGEIPIAAIVDKRMSGDEWLYDGIPFVSAQALTELNLQDTTIVVTAASASAEIVSELKGRGVERVISIQELLHTP